MSQSNRVKTLYEVAVKYFSLPPMARYVIGTQFLIAKWEEFVLNEDEMSDKIFLKAIDKKVYTEFCQVIKDYKSNGNYSE